MKPFDLTSRQLLRPLAAIALAATLTACLPAPEGQEGAALSGVVMARSIPVAHTPPGGYGKTFPPPVLATCTEPLSPGAPDLRGIWKVLRAERGGKTAPPGDPIYGYVERIEQCGNRIVDMGGGTVSDGRADGTFKKFKASLVARGDMLKNIFDPDTYAGTVRTDSIRILLSLAAEHDLDLVSHDIKTAFLYSDLKPEENIFLRRPTGVSDDIMPYIVQLKKYLHGLPQASKYFDEHLSARLLAMGF
jgi:hypothetical protein